MGNSKLDDIRERLVIYDAPHIDRMPAGIYLEDVGALLAVVEAVVAWRDMDAELSYDEEEKAAQVKILQTVAKLTGGE